MQILHEQLPINDILTIVFVWFRYACFNNRCYIG